MIDLLPEAVPELSHEWIEVREWALVEACSHRRHRPVKWVALAGVSGVAATVSTLVLVGGSPQSAFAGWSAAPTQPAPGQLTAAANDCQEGLAQIPPGLKGGDPSSLVPELSDVRGPFTVTVFRSDAQNEVVCTATQTDSANTAVHWIASPSDAAVNPGEVAVDHISSLGQDGQPYTLVVGRTGTAVTGVTLSLDDGSQVTATSGNGIFIAWWPGSQSIASASVATDSGVTTQTLNHTQPATSSTPGTKSPATSPGGPSSTGSANNTTVCLNQAACEGAGG